MTETSMQVLLVVKGMHPRSGGPPAVVAGSAEALATRGHKVTVLTSAPPSDRPEIAKAWSSMFEAGVAIRYLRDGGVRAFVDRSPDHAAIGELVRAADVVHLHGIWAPILTIAARAAHHAERPYLVSPHGMLDRRAMGTTRAKFLKKRLGIELLGFRSLLTRASSLIFGNEAESSSSWRPAKASRVVYIPNGVAASTGIADPSPDDLDRLYSVLPETRGWSPLVLCRSRIDRQKGIDLLIRAFAEASRVEPDTRVLIAGLRHDRAYEAELEALIVELGLQNRVALTTSLTGARSQFLYKVADIVATPSVFEGFSVGLLEGLAYGRPMLITRPCHMEIVEQRGAGIMAEANVASIADALTTMLAMPGHERVAMGHASRELFEQEYTWATVARRLAETYAGAIAETDA